METEKKVQAFVKTNNLLDKNVQTVYVATSGGADSMALLAFMRKNTDKEIIAVHVNHGLRGETADRDQKFVEDYCKVNNIQCIVFNAKIDGTYIPEHASEEWARNLRYNYFSSLPQKNAVIATAHTASDNAETLLFRLARGCGIKGLVGVPAKRNNIIRPFLCLTRKETEDLVEYYGTNNITDESNLTDDYARNKLRHNAIPLLKQINPNAELSMSKTSDRLGRIYEYINKTANLHLAKAAQCNGRCYSTPSLQQEDVAILEQMIMIVLEPFEHSEVVVEDIVRDILSYGNNSESEIKIREYPLNNEYTAVLTTKTFSVEKNNESLEKNLVVGDNIISNWGHNIEVIQCSYQEFQEDTVDKFNKAYYLDGDRFPLQSLLISTKKNGDTFKPACRYKTKLINHMSGFSLVEKNNVPVIRNADGDVVFLYGTGFTDGMLPTNQTKTIYRFNCRRAYDTRMG